MKEKGAEAVREPGGAYMDSQTIQSLKHFGREHTCFTFPRTF